MPPHHPGQPSTPGGASSTVPQSRVLAERRWRLGLHSRGHPSALMAELYRVLQVTTAPLSSSPFPHMLSHTVPHAAVSGRGVEEDGAIQPQVPEGHQAAEPQAEHVRSDMGWKIA